MGRYVVHVDVMPRAGVLDPAGEATKAALGALGFSGVGSVRIGKRITLEVEAPNREAAGEAVRAMTERLLANPVIEEHSISVEEHQAPGIL